MEKNNDLKIVEKEIVKVQLIALPGIVLLGLGWYGIEHGLSGNAFHPLLNDKNIIYSCVGIGIFAMIWEIKSLFPLWKKRSKIKNDLI